MDCKWKKVGRGSTWREDSLESAPLTLEMKNEEEILTVYRIKNRKDSLY
jgi:hypothetical protein